VRVDVIADIENLPERLNDYIVVRRGDDWKLWYWGTYDNKDRAKMACAEIGNGVLLEVKEWKKQ